MKSKINKGWLSLIFETIFAFLFCLLIKTMGPGDAPGLFIFWIAFLGGFVITFIISMVLFIIPLIKHNENEISKPLPNIIGLILSLFLPIVLIILVLLFTNSRTY